MLQTDLIKLPRLRRILSMLSADRQRNRSSNLCQICLPVGFFAGHTAHLRAAQSGAYLHLIMHYWQHGGVPDNDAQLAAIARMTDRVEEGAADHRAVLSDAGVEA